MCIDNIFKHGTIDCDLLYVILNRGEDFHFSAHEGKYTIKLEQTKIVDMSDTLNIFDILFQTVLQAKAIPTAKVDSRDELEFRAG